jgi:hypothetical protein
MPPATEPIPYLVLQNLQAALAFSGSDYWYAPVVVKVGEDPLDAIALPALMIGEPGVLGKYEDNKKGSALGHANVHWKVPVVGVIPYTSSQAETVRNLLRLAADVLKAVRVDFKRGGYALDTAFEGWSIIDSPVSEDDVRPWMACMLDIHMIFRDTDMATQ